MDKMFLPYARYAEFGGRSTRTEFWLYSLFTFAVMTGLVFAAGGVEILERGASDAAIEEFFMSIPFLLLAVFVLFNVIPGLAVTLRRFHDAGFSGWIWVGLIVLSLVPVIGFLADLAILVICVLPSVQSNQWGENPNDGWERDSNFGYDRPKPAARPDGVRYR